MQSGLMNGLGPHRNVRPQRFNGGVTIAAPKTNVVGYGGASGSPGYLDASQAGVDPALNPEGQAGADVYPATALRITGTYGTPSPSLPAQSPQELLIAVNDCFGIQIMGLYNAGGLVVTGDKISVAPGAFGPFLALDGSVNPPGLLVNNTNHVYFGTGSYTSTLATTPCVLNDWYVRLDGTTASGTTGTARISKCTTAGTPGTFTGFA